MEHYRNKLDMISYENVHVDAESLWEKKGDLMILADEDQYVTYPFDENKFYKVTVSDPLESEKRKFVDKIYEIGKKIHDDKQNRNKLN